LIKHRETEHSIIGSIVFVCYFSADVPGMLKKIILLICLIALALPATVDAQSITRSQYNGFTSEYDIETSIVTLKQGYTTGFGMALRAVSNALYLTFIGYGKKNTLVNEDERIQLLLLDGTVIKFPARAQLPSNESGVPNLYIHHYFISKREVELLTKSPAVIMRVVSETSHNDIPVKKKCARQLMKLGDMFLKEMVKY
jgi:hypothetical protein